MKEVMHADDVIPKLMARTGETQQTIFARELEKYEPRVAEISALVKEHELFFAQVEQAFGRLISTSKTLVQNEASARNLAQRTGQARRLIDTLRDAMQDLVDGEAFYNRLAAQATQLKQHKDSYVAARKAEAATLCASIKAEQANQQQRQLSESLRRLNLAPGAAGTGAPTSAAPPATASAGSAAPAATYAPM
ncbi:hypothetical protein CAUPRSCDRAFT_12954, partial [Caulochytrium protostelioides]